MGIRIKKGIKMGFQPSNAEDFLITALRASEKSTRREYESHSLALGR